MNNKIYFAKEQESGEVFVGVKGTTGFSELKNLKLSIGYKFKYSYGTKKSCEEHDFYCLNTDTMEVSKIQ